MRRKTWKKGIALALTASLLMTTACGNNVDKEDTEVETSKKKQTKIKTQKTIRALRKMFQSLITSLMQHISERKWLLKERIILLYN